MKTISLLITLIFLFSFGVGVLAQETELPSPGLTPDSPFYFFDNLGEKIGMFFTFGAEKKAERALQYAGEKLAEAKEMAEKNKIEATERANQNYQGFLGLANTEIQKAKEQGKDVEELVTLITEKILKHQEILIEVFKKVPEEAKIAIEKAIEASRKGSEEAVQAVTGAKKEELQKRIEEVKTNVEILRETADWEVYQNDKYRFEVKYPKNWNITEMEPASDENFLSKIYMFEAAGLFVNEIQVFENKNALDDISQLRDFIMQWYGLTTQFPFPESKIKEFKINNQPAIQIDYIEKGEHPATDTPAILLFSLTKQYFYRLGCIGKGDNCHQILSTFKFIELEEVKEVPEVEEAPEKEEVEEAPKPEDPKSEEEPYIRVISPNGGEEWEVGNTYNITWISEDIEKVDIFFLGCKTKECPIETRMGAYSILLHSSLDTETGRYSWTISRQDIDFDFLCFKVKIKEAPRWSVGILNNFLAMLAPIVNKLGILSTQTSDLVEDVSDTCFTIIEKELPPEEKITVTFPNGGEIWQIYSDHRITWTPDPESRYVQAYLEKMENGDFITIGRIIPGGKGSIQWNGEIDRSENYASPGDYYVRLVNTQTNTIDRSDGAFKLVAANDFVKADIKVKSADGIYSDGPVTVETRTIQVLWNSAVANACRLVASSKDTYDVTSFDNLSTSAVDKQILLPGNKDAYYVHLICDSSLYGGNTGSDLISINILCSLPEAPVLIDPGVSVIKDETFTVNCTKVDRVTEYRFQSGTNPNFSWYREGSVSENFLIFTPEVSTTYYFRVKACNYCGCSSWSNVVDMEVIVPSITVTSPNGGEEFFQGADYTIIWKSTGAIDNVGITICMTPASYTQTSQIETRCSEMVVVSNTGSYSDSFGAAAVIGNYTVKVEDTFDSSIYDESDNYFSIIEPSIVLTVPIGGEKWKLGETYQITWDSVGIKDIQIQVIGPIPDLMTISLTSNPGYYDLTIGSDFPIDSNYKIYISGTGYNNKTYADWMDPDNSFSIIPSITVTSPNGGEQRIKGNTYDITWTSLGVDNVRIDVDFHGNGSIHSYTLVSDVPVVSGTWSWTIGAKHSDLPTGDQVKIAVIPCPVGEDSWDSYDQSDNYFSITEP